jgi:putative ATP-dependent endonuclease of OLD family
MTWLPAPGSNLILGGGDVGKTTVLDAIALLLSPTNPNVVPETDYYARQEENGFVIDAVISLPDDSKINSLLKAAWPWDWDGEKPIVPNIDGDDTQAHNEPVYWLQVTGTPELDLVYEVKQPDGTSETMPLALRRQLGPVRLSSDDRNDRDLRFVQGSALDRLLSDKTLRSRLSSKLAETNVADVLNDDSKNALSTLSDAFAMRSLPTELGRISRNSFFRSRTLSARLWRFHKSRTSPCERQNRSAGTSIRCSVCRRGSARGLWENTPGRRLCRGSRRK